VRPVLDALANIGMARRLASTTTLLLADSLGAQSPYYGVINMCEA
jgi:hypothetical protein